MENISDTVIEQLREIRAASDASLGSRQQVRREAEERGYTELVEFINREDDSTYHDALILSAGSG